MFQQQFMLTEDIKKQLSIKTSISTSFQNPAFKIDVQLWKKQSINPQTLSQSVTSKKYQFFKVGKTFGLETKRYVSIKGNYLLYYNDVDSDKIQGFCDLENVYIYYLETKEHKFLLFLTNGTYSSSYYFSDSQFFTHLKPKVKKMVIQLNFNDQYSIIDLIGQGSFSKVYLAKSKQNSFSFAVKIVSKKDKHKGCTKKCVEEEKKALSTLTGYDSIYRFQQFFEQQQNFIIVMQYLSGKDLMNLIRQKTQFSFPQILSILRQILQSLSYCHSNRIIHRDIKPQNIILDTNSFKVKLIDFGLSLLVTPSTQIDEFKRCGTMGYMAPQVIQSTSDKRKSYNYKCDIFSFGIISHMLLLGYNPLKGRNYQQTEQLNKQCKIELNKKLIVEKYGINCYQMLQSALMKNPKIRLSAQQLLQLPLFKKNCQSLSNLKSNKYNFSIEKKHHLDEISTQGNKILGH